ncbi:hypothetical protein BKK42_17450 [Bacillus cereus]|nr:hypothetical protein BKK43_22185 [Bacillus cereus]ONG81527.1 hypothetical protein BKK42_17450 [Bacillus cereus]
MQTKKMLASRRITLYNRQCWSLTAMKWKVADTPGRFAMAWCEEISMEKVYFRNRRTKEGK